MWDKPCLQNGSTSVPSLIFFNLLEKDHTLVIQPVLWVKTLHCEQHIYRDIYLYALHIQKKLRSYWFYGRSVIGLSSDSVHWKEYKKHSIVRNPDNCIGFKLWKHMEGKLLQWTQ